MNTSQFEPQRLSPRSCAGCTQARRSPAQPEEEDDEHGSRQTGALRSVDGRTKLAGSNRMEILLFPLGTQEIFGINVFKVREVSRTPFITKGAQHAGWRGRPDLLRGNVIPVLALAQ